MEKNKITISQSPGESFEDYCHRISSQRGENGWTWTKIAEIINKNTGVDFSADKYRKLEKRKEKLSKQIGENNPTYRDDWKDWSDEEKCPIFEKEVVEFNYEKGETTSTKELMLTPEELRNPKALLEAHGFDSNSFVIKTASHTQTNRLTPDGNSFYYSSRILVRPKTSNDIGIEEIDRYFETFNEKNYKSIKITPKQYDAEGEFLEICLQDLHMGLLSYEQETGEDYDVNIAKERLENCVSDITQRCKGRKFKRIVLALLGDILHVDNLDGTTTKGTRQDVDTRPTRIFDEALTLLITTITQLGKIAPIEVVNLQGNHDKLTSYCLCKSLEMAFREDSNVTFFNSPNPRKWRRYGNVLIGYAHGDMKPNAITEWLSNECEEWSSAKYREVHLGHLHSLQTIQKIEDNKYGLIARYLPSLCASSAWEHDMGYPKSQRGMMSFVWNEETGLREVWYSNI